MSWFWNPGRCEPEVVRQRLRSKRSPPSPAPHTAGGSLAGLECHLSHQMETLVGGHSTRKQPYFRLYFLFCLPQASSKSQAGDSPFLCAGQCFRWAGLWAGRRVLGLGLWGSGGGCGRAFDSPPTSLTGSASPFPGQPLDTGPTLGLLLAAQLCAFPQGRRPSLVPPLVTHSCSGPQPQLSPG